MKFLKYEFLPSDWETIKQSLYEGEGINNDLCLSVVEIGYLPISESELSDKISVDIIWKTDELESFSPYKVWPDGIGCHSFGESIDTLYREAHEAQNN